MPSANNSAPATQFVSRRLSVSERSARRVWCAKVSEELKAAAERFDHIAQTGDLEFFEDALWSLLRANGTLGDAVFAWHSHTLLQGGREVGA